MSRKRELKWLWRVAAIAIAVSLASPAFAKKRKDDLGKGDVEQEIEKVDVKNVDERSEEEQKAAVEARKKEIEELGGEAPADRKDEVSAPEVDPEKVDEILKEIESKNKQLVGKFETLLKKSPTNAKAPEWMFQIAELKWEVASYKHLRDMRKWGAEVDALAASNTPEEEWPETPVPDYSESIEYYKKIVSTYGSYPRLDEVLFKLGDGLIRAGQAKEGVGYLHRITKTYPDSKYLDRVYLSLGEYYFDNRNIGTAQAAYEKIVNEYPESRAFNYAQYKLGWTFMNQGDEEGFKKAIDTFRKVVEHMDSQYGKCLDKETGVLDENCLPTGEVSFRNQAINDLIKAYAEIDGGWKEARDYLEGKLSPERHRRKMEMFAEYLAEKGEFSDRNQIYRELIAKDPLHPRIPTYAERLIDSHFNEGHKEKIETVTREFIDYFQPNGKWALANANNEREFRQARQFAEDKLYSLAANYLIEANKAVERDDEEEAERLFNQAREDHEAFLERYPDSQYAYDMNFYYAYILDETSDRRMEELKDKLGNKPEQFRQVARSEVLPDLKAAAGQFQKVIDMREQVPEDSEDRTRVSANRQVFVYANILATVDPDWSIEASGDAKNFRAEKKDSEIKEAEPLVEQEEDFVKAAEQYAGLFPKHEDTPGFLWRAAEIYRSRHHYNAAAQRFDDLVSNFPKHEYAGQAVGSMFALYNKAENWPKIEHWAEWLIDQRNFKVYTKPELEDAIGYSIGNQSKDLYDAKKYEAAAEKLYTLKDRFPERERLVAPAILGAANIYRDGGLVPEAIAKYEEYRASFPKREESPFATFQAALLYNEKTDFEKAAELFEGLPDEVAAVEAAAAAAPEDKDEKKDDDEDKKKDRAEEAATESGGGEVDYPKANRTNQYVALFNAVQIREGLQQWDKAIANAKRYLEMNPDGKGNVYEHPEEGYLRPNGPDAGKPELLAKAKLVVNREGTVYHLGEIYQQAGKSQEAIDTYRSYLENFADNKPVRIKARLEIAKEIGKLKARGWKKAQDEEFEKIERLIGELEGEDAKRSRTLIAEMKFIQGDRKFAEFEEVKLEFPVRKLRKLIKEKAALRTEAEKIYKEVADLKVARWSSAAAYRVGEMALDFRDNFKALPMPPELENDPDGQEEYIAWIEDELIYPAEDAAIAGFQFAVDLAHQLKVYNEWSRKSAEALSELNADAFPVTGERGVATEHVGKMIAEPKFVVGPMERGPKELEEGDKGKDAAGAAEAEGAEEDGGGAKDDTSKNDAKGGDDASKADAEKDAKNDTKNP